MKRMIGSEKQQNVVAVCTPTGGFFDFLHTPVSNDRPPLLFLWQEATGSPNCLSGIEFPPHRTISILQGVLLVLSPNYHTVAIWLLNNCYYACRFKWEKYGTEHDYEWTNVVLNIIYCIYLQEAHSSQQTFWRNRFIMEYFRREFKSTFNQSFNLWNNIWYYFNWTIQRFQHLR